MVWYVFMYLCIYVFMNACICVYTLVCMYFTDQPIVGWWFILVVYSPRNPL